MGQPVVHFEVVGKDREKLQNYYTELFGWQVDANNPMNYGIVSRDDNLSPEGFGIGGGIGQGPEGYDGHSTFYIGGERRAKRDVQLSDLLALCASPP